ncbi:MAG: integral membrane protein [Crocinitomicaceae bacterium]|jgi:integral membrane protein
MTLKTLLGQLRILAILEGISWILLIIAMLLKYGMDIPGPTKIVGMAHGVLFIGFCIWVVLYAVKVKWPLKTTLICLAASLLPFTTFIVDAKIFKKEA